MQFYINVGASCFWDIVLGCSPFTSRSHHCNQHVLNVLSFEDWSEDLILLTIFKCVDKMHPLDYCYQVPLFLGPNRPPSALGNTYVFHVWDWSVQLSPRACSVPGDVVTVTWTGRQVRHIPLSRQAALWITHAGRCIFFHSICNISSNL